MEQRWNAAMAALNVGDPLKALDHVALGDDAPSLALRGIAMAQLGELGLGKQLLSRAARLFGTRDRLSRARCVSALAEIAMAARDLAVPLSTLRGALRTLEARGDVQNALHARLVLARTAVLSGDLAGAERTLAEVRLRHAPPMLIATTELVRAELALRRMEPGTVESALERARRAAEFARIPALQREIAALTEALAAPAARLVASGTTQALRLQDVERVFAEEAWIVDACRRRLCCGSRPVDFSRQPVLFALLRTLAEAWPDGASRESLVLNGFGARTVNASHRARLRVELGRLRKKLQGTGDVAADAHGYRLDPRADRVVVLAPPTDGDDGALLALLRDGSTWSTSALALALGMSQRSLQRCVAAAEEAGKVRGVGSGRSRRWFAAPVAEVGPQVYGLFAYGAQSRAEQEDEA